MICDSLVSVENRNTFLQALNDTLEASPSPSTKINALLILELRNIETLECILDCHHIDRLLDSIMDSLKNILRDADIVYRIGDYQFGFLLPALLSKEIIHLATNKILQTLEKPFNINMHDVYLRGHIGAVFCHASATKLETQLRCAKVALHNAINTKSPLAIYQPEYDQSAEYNFDLDAELRHAIDEDEFNLYYQPQIDLTSGKTISAEALIRWNNKKHGMIPPDLFISLAEKRGLINQITEWVLENGLRYQNFLNQKGLDVNMAFNISAYDLYDREFPDMVEQQIETWACSPDNIMLEITEGVMMHDPDTALKRLVSCKNLGVRLSIDDFGTGYSSLAYLKDFPVNELKIDRSFVSDLVSNGANERIVRSVIDLAHHFGLEVVAEGVEDESTLNLLKEFGCDKIQGYLISRPLSEEDFFDWMGLKQNARYD